MIETIYQEMMKDLSDIIAPMQEKSEKAVSKYKITALLLSIT